VSRSLIAQARIYSEGARLWLIEDEAPFLPLLPPTLRSLDIGRVHASSNQVQAALADSSTLPSLRKLVLGDSTQVGDSWGRDEDTYWPSHGRSSSDKKAIQELCDARSVRLEWEEWEQGEHWR
jgi:hypothetical protein